MTSVIDPQPMTAGATATVAATEAAPQTAPVLSLSSVSRYFGGVKAVDDVSFDVYPGELFTLLGPSGCGKTKTLQQIAGLEQPDAGEIRYRGEPVAAPARGLVVPPERRQMGMVFQSYAIWPHLNVFENVAYPLRVRKVVKQEIAPRVERVLELVGMGHLAKRSVSALSGGQQQRVALARALVYEPDLLLLDEPFSNLDAQLREQMCLELKLLQQRLGLAVVMVTHDQSEALALSDRIAVLDQGHLEQVANPHELYDRPESRFVRDFIGATVTATGVALECRDDATVVGVEAWGGAQVVAAGHHIGQVRPGEEVELSIRPEALHVVGEAGAVNSVPAVVQAVLFEGAQYKAQAAIGTTVTTIHLDRSRTWGAGDTVVLSLSPEAVGVAAC